MSEFERVMKMLGKEASCDLIHKEICVENIGSHDTAVIEQIISSVNTAGEHDYPIMQITFKGQGKAKVMTGEFDGNRGVAEYFDLERTENNDLYQVVDFYLMLVDPF